MKGLMVTFASVMGGLRKGGLSTKKPPRFGNEGA